jgi:hypothetical protein
VLPIVVAYLRNTGSVLTVALISVLLGWTGIGLIVAFVVAFASPSRPRRVPHARRRVYPAPLVTTPARSYEGFR